MASWSKKSMWVRLFEWAGNNQYGDRYKEKASKSISICRIEVGQDDTSGLRNLILLSSQLDVPVRYDFGANPQVAYIEVVSAEKLRELL
jgi:hypothetical protein